MLKLTIEGRLDSNTTGKVWREANTVFEKTSPNRVIVDASKIDYCDASGIALLVDLLRRQSKTGGLFEIQNLAGDFQPLLDLFPQEEFKELDVEKPKKTNPIEEVGQTIGNMFNFLGVCTSLLLPQYLVLY